VSPNLSFFFFLLLHAEEGVGIFFYSHGVFFSIVYSTPVLLCSSKARPQAWHIDSPLPDVLVNLVYLDDGQMTQFMVPAALPSSILRLKAPSSELFAPCGISSGDGPGVVDKDLISGNWVKYLQKR
jgi:hypothetical protein